MSARPDQNAQHDIYSQLSEIGTSVLGEVRENVQCLSELSGALNRCSIRPERTIRKRHVPPVS